MIEATLKKELLNSQDNQWKMWRLQKGLRDRLEVANGLSPSTIVPYLSDCYEALADLSRIWMRYFFG